MRHEWHALVVQVIMVTLQFFGLIAVVLLQRIVRSLAESVQKVMQHVQVSLTGRVEHEFDTLLSSKKNSRE